MSALATAKAMAARLGISISPWQGHMLKAAAADAAEWEATIAHAMALGGSEVYARAATKWLRQNTSWSWAEIREEMTRIAGER